MWKLIIALILLLLFFGGPFYVLLSGKLVLNQHWQDADRSSAGMAPIPSEHPAALVQAYAARAYAHRGMFAVHAWIAVKPYRAAHYTVYQCIGWNKWWDRPIIDVRQDIPDRIWFGHRPKLLFSLSGPAAGKAIAEIRQAAQDYPFQDKYHVWPGPNSNTFIAYVMRKVPAMRFRLPSTAIGKDYAASVCTKTPSKTGYQCNIKGWLGVALARKEGIELNVLGFNIAANTSFPFIHLPGLG